MKINFEEYMFSLIKELWPITRSITGPGIRESLEIIQKQVPELEIKEVPTGTKVFDWEVPQEWSINEAYIIDPEGNKIIDFKNNNLHVVNFSAAINKTVTLEELQEHLHSLPEQPDAIPYITSYYQKRWGFCLSHKQRENLKQGEYKVVIDSKHYNGHLVYGELILHGLHRKEIFLSTYLCHPSMANNELSGPVVVASLANWLSSLTNREYTYRIIFIPETIGSITYLSKNIDVMKKYVVAGFNVTCVGDEADFSYISSRNENTLSDRILQHVLSHSESDYTKYSYLERGSDERQYCSPGVDLPVATLCRSKFGNYPEYHTSLDNLDFISEFALEGSFEILKQSLLCIENNKYIYANVLCEPQLGKRGLYPTLGIRDNEVYLNRQMDVLSYADGRSLLEIAETINVPMWELFPIIERLEKHKLIRVE